MLFVDNNLASLFGVTGYVGNGHGPVADKSDVFEMIADNLSVFQIVILFDQTSIKQFVSTTPDKNQSGVVELGKRKNNGSCIDFNAGNRFVTLFVSAVMNASRIIDKVVTMKFKKDFTTGPVDF